ncbi:MAG: hypothetical protein HY735_25925 [Verrucomicrobia bacterium]|nr:hypothetical protein [Verrucomicrobiota bacterium]
MKPTLARRSFIQKSLAASVAAPIVTSLEEHALVAHAAAASATGAPARDAAKMPMGVIGKVKISRLICGGNLISGYAHSRDLIYLSRLLTQYFTDQKIMDTWAICEQHGINTMICYPGDPHAVQVYEKYRAQGGKIQYLAQIGPKKNDLKTAVKQAVDAGASGAFLVGNLGDQWTREGAVGLIGELISIIKDHGLISGVAGHELRVPMMVEKAGIAPDFYMKTLHSMNYWSRRQSGQDKEIIDNYGIDNYWCLDPEATVAFMRSMKRPWIAYKVLAAGAIHPREGFRHAFENGADFAVVGMFDFQIAEDVAAVNEILAGPLHRTRPWLA